MKFSDCKTVYNFAEEIGEDAREIINNIDLDEESFDVGNYRFIKESEIDRIQQEELSSDPYILGCFNDWFIADNTDLSYDIVKALQKSESFEAIGQHIIDNDYVSDIQQAYSSEDGYGHYFSGYDGETMEDLLHLGYYCFRTN